MNSQNDDHGFGGSGLALDLIQSKAFWIRIDKDRAWSGTIEGSLRAESSVFCPGSRNRIQSQLMERFGKDPDVEPQRHEGGKGHVEEHDEKDVLKLEKRSTI